jgi:predicted outer membrane repeat protein
MKSIRQLPLTGSLAKVALLTALLLPVTVQSQSASVEVVPDRGAQRGGVGVVWVGPGSDPNCQSSNLQSTINGLANNTQGFATVNVRLAGDGSTFQGQGFEVNMGTFQDIHHLNFIGGHESCGASHDPTASRLVFDAQGNGRVFDVSYAVTEGAARRSVGFQLLSIRGGIAPDEQWNTNGGGIRVFARPGRFEMRLIDTEILGNAAPDGDGGGIYLRGSASEIVDDPGNPDEGPLLFIDDRSIVFNNFAGEDGGGIHCSNAFTPGAIPLIRAGSALIQNNTAGRHGGGVYAENCYSVFRTGSPWYFSPTLSFFTGGIVNNTAEEHGGGLYITGTNLVTVSGVVRDDDYGGDPENAALVLGNQAVRGGGVYIVGPDATLWAWDTDFAGNVAVTAPNGSGGNGGAIYASDEASVWLKRWDFTEDIEVVPCLEVPLVLGFNAIPRCSRIRGNHAQNAGGGIFAWNGTSLTLSDHYITDNSSDGANGSFLHARSSTVFDPGSPTEVTIHNALISENSGGTVVYAGTGSKVEVAWSTIAGNEVPGGNSLLRAFSSDASYDNLLDVRQSIVWNDLGSQLATQGGSGDTQIEAFCVIGFQEEQDSGIDNATYYSQIYPEFVDPEAGNFNLSINSPAINYCRGSNAPDVDLNRFERGQVFEGDTIEPPNPDSIRVYDIGAFVVRGDQLFRDRFSL